MQPEVQWMAPAPLWRARLQGSDPAKARRPVLLRFTSDAFMDELIAQLETDPGALGQREAVPESFQEAPLGVSSSWKPPEQPLKLYQPVHGHFYLVSMSLVCRKIGMPDHRVDVARKEASTFVMRRWSEDSTGKTVEYAWLEKGGGWVPTSDPLKLVEGEAQRPLFPLAFQWEKRSRRLWAGFIPVASAETANASSEVSPIDTSSQEDFRPDEVHQRVIVALLALKDTSQPRSDALSRADDNSATLFLLLDLADVLQRYAPNVWKKMKGESVSLSSAEQTLYNNLGSYSLNVYASDGSVGTVIWRTATSTAWNQVSEIFTGTSSLGYNARGTSLPAESGGLEQWLSAVYQSTSPPAIGADVIAAPRFDTQDSTIRYVIRCVYTRPFCKLEDALVSPESEPFKLAQYFDPDAPVRPIRISMPIDTSIAGLRKFRKNVAFLISPKLREQMARVTEDTLREGKLGAAASFDLGRICSLSIPIITLCAFILLFVIVIILNIVFWWLPFFKICFPLKKPE